MIMNRKKIDYKKLYLACKKDREIELEYWRSFPEALLDLKKRLIEKHGIEKGTKELARYLNGMAKSIYQVEKARLFEWVGEPIK